MDNPDQIQEPVDAVEPTATPAATDPVAPPAAADVVEDWFRRHFFNLGAGISEELYNRIHAAKEDLQASLVGYTHP